MRAPIASPILLAASILTLLLHSSRRSFLSYARILSTPLAPFTLSSASGSLLLPMLPPPREYIQFASDARRDRAEIDVCLVLFLIVDDRDKRKKKNWRKILPTLLINFTYVRVWNRVHLHKYKSPLRFSCAFCDRFGTINWTAPYFEFAYKVSVFLPLVK